jgi:exodeoxyribonuclease V alpha subunit
VIEPVDAMDARRALAAPEPLRAFNEAGVLAAADVHVALRVAALAGETDSAVLLATALAVRGPRLGHVYVDLATIAEQAAVDADEPVELSTLPWPAVDTWTRALSSSVLVATGQGDDAPGRPLRLNGTHLYLDRYWREETRVAADLRAFGERAPLNIDEQLLAESLNRLFPRDADERQRLAAATATRRRLTVVAGGPGTGKTTAVARILALLFEQAAAAEAPEPLVALAAPTGKAAARLEEAVHAEARELNVAPEVSEHLLELDGSTLHRLLGWRPGSHSRFRHDRSNHLPHDIVVVDETSMVSLSLMARLVEAVRPGARLILVGDPGQLTSIEAGAVLGDIVGPAAEASQPASAGAARRGADGRGSIGDGIVVLDRSHRFGPGIAAVADAVRRGDAGATLEALRGHPGEVTWIPVDVAVQPDALGVVRDGAVAAGRAVVTAAAAGDRAGALEAIGAFRVLCAHRRGDHGAQAWRARVESWLAAAIDGFAGQGEWYVGRPLLMTENDYGLRLYNGDTGVVVAGPDGRAAAAFERHEQLVSPARLEAVETVYAMTIHKAQGSQFHTAVVLLPPASSPILTRELLYTAVTRARTRLVVAGTEDAVRAAVARPVARASGLRERLWGAGRGEPGASLASEP